MLLPCSMLASRLILILDKRIEIVLPDLTVDRIISEGSGGGVFYIAC